VNERKRPIIDRPFSVAILDGVRARACIEYEDVPPVFANQQIVAGASDNEVSTVSSNQYVVAIVAVQRAAYTHPTIYWTVRNTVHSIASVRRSYAFILGLLSFWSEH
jgi:hypothetical protein